MAEYISRKEALENWPLCDEPGDAYQYIKNLPAADVRPVVRGHWIGTKEAADMGDIMKEFTCSVCGCCEWDCTESESFNFCPKCGADMREETE